MQIGGIHCGVALTGLVAGQKSNPHPLKAKRIRIRGTARAHILRGQTGLLSVHLSRLGLLHEFCKRFLGKLIGVGFRQVDF